MYGKPEHRPRITDYQYVMALVQSGGLAVYGRFLHCPLSAGAARRHGEVSGDGNSIATRVGKALATATASRAASDEEPRRSASAA